jgi:hypothetical protein
MDSDILSTINGENSVDGVQNWNETSDDESFDFDQSQSTEKKLIKNKKVMRSHTMAIQNDPLRSQSN